MFIYPASLPIQVCCAGVWHVYLHCIPTYRRLSRQDLACLVTLCPTYRSLSRLGLVCLFTTLHPYLQRHSSQGSNTFIRPVSPTTETCCAWVWYVICPGSLPTEACHAGVSHVLSSCNLYFHRFVAPGSGMSIYPSSLPTECQL